MAMGLSARTETSGKTETNPSKCFRVLDVTQLEELSKPSSSVLITAFVCVHRNGAVL